MIPSMGFSCGGLQLALQYHLMAPTVPFAREGFYKTITPSTFDLKYSKICSSIVFASLSGELPDIATLSPKGDCQVFDNRVAFLRFNSHFFWFRNLREF